MCRSPPPTNLWVSNASHANQEDSFYSANPKRFERASRAAQASQKYICKWSFTNSPGSLTYSSCGRASAVLIISVGRGHATPRVQPKLALPFTLAGNAQLSGSPTSRTKHQRKGSFTRGARRPIQTPNLVASNPPAHAAHMTTVFPSVVVARGSASRSTSQRHI